MKISSSVSNIYKYCRRPFPPEYDDPRGHIEKGLSEGEGDGGVVGDLLTDNTQLQQLESELRNLMSMAEPLVEIEDAISEFYHDPLSISEVLVSGYLNGCLKEKGEGNQILDTIYSEYLFRETQENLFFYVLKGGKQYAEGSGVYDPTIREIHNAFIQEGQEYIAQSGFAVDVDAVLKRNGQDIAEDQSEAEKAIKEIQNYLWNLAVRKYDPMVRDYFVTSVKTYKPLDLGGDRMTNMFIHKLSEGINFYNNSNKKTTGVENAGNNTVRITKQGFFGQLRLQAVIHITEGSGGGVEWYGMRKAQHLEFAPPVLQSLLMRQESLIAQVEKKCKGWVDLVDSIDEDKGVLMEFLISNRERMYREGVLDFDIDSGYKAGNFAISYVYSVFTKYAFENDPIGQSGDYSTINGEVRHGLDTLSDYLSLEGLEDDDDDDENRAAIIKRLMDITPNLVMLPTILWIDDKDDRSRSISNLAELSEYLIDDYNEQVEFGGGVNPNHFPLLENSRLQLSAPDSNPVKKTLYKDPIVNRLYHLPSGEIEALLPSLEHYYGGEGLFNLENIVMMFDDLPDKVLMEKIENERNGENIYNALMSRIRLATDEKNLSYRYSSAQRVLLDAAKSPYIDDVRRNELKSIRKRISNDGFEQYNNFAIEQGLGRANKMLYESSVDGTVKKRLGKIGRNYLSTLSPYNLTHIGWDNFLKKHVGELNKYKKLLADSDIYQADLNDVDYVLSYWQRVYDKYGDKYANKFKLLKEKVDEFGLSEFYKASIEKGEIGEEDLKFLDQIYKIDRRYLPKARDYNNFKKRLSESREVFQIDRENPYFQVIPTDKSTIDNRFEFEVTSKDDPVNYILGNLTACCQTIGGMAESCVVDGVTNPNAGFLVIRETSRSAGAGKVLAQAYMWQKSLEVVGNREINMSKRTGKYDLSQVYLVLDNIEMVKGGQLDRNALVRAVSRWAREYKQQYGYAGILLGRGYNELNIDRFKDSSEIGRQLIGVKKQDMKIWFEEYRAGVEPSFEDEDEDADEEFYSDADTAGSVQLASRTIGNLYTYLRTACNVRV